MNKILVIIPAFNEAVAIRGVVEDVRFSLKEADLLVINDCSGDGTAEILDASGINHLDLPVNTGIGGAVQAGLKYALEKGYDIAVRIDGDGQHDPAYIGEMLKVLISGEADMAIGSRFMETGGYKSTFSRRAGIRFLGSICRIITKMKITDITSGFHAYGRKAMAAIYEHYPQDFPEPEVIIIMSKLGIKIKEIPVKMKPRNEGVSSIRGFKAPFYVVKVALAMIIGNLRRYDGKPGNDV